MYFLLIECAVHKPDTGSCMNIKIVARLNFVLHLDRLKGSVIQLILVVSLYTNGCHQCVLG